MKYKKLSPETFGIVKDMRALLSSPEKWTQHWFARDKDGRACDSKNGRAVCWCLAGAFVKVSDKTVASHEFDEFKGLFPGQAVSNWNDSQAGYNAVAKRLDEIIKDNA